MRPQCLSGIVDGLDACQVHLADPVQGLSDEEGRVANPGVAVLFGAGVVPPLLDGDVRVSPPGVLGVELQQQGDDRLVDRHAAGSRLFLQSIKFRIKFRP